MGRVDRKALLTSSRIVTGPSFTRLTFIRARSALRHLHSRDRSRRRCPEHRDGNSGRAAATKTPYPFFVSALEGELDTTSASPRRR